MLPVIVVLSLIVILVATDPSGPSEDESALKTGNRGPSEAAKLKS